MAAYHPIATQARRGSSVVMCFCACHPVGRNPRGSVVTAEGVLYPLFRVVVGGGTMGMLADWLPAVCSRLKIFLSYASEDRRVAEDLAQQLKGQGHIVFFDQDSLPVGGDYNDRIRRAVAAADRFVFLASKNALQPGRYTLTELEFAKERWPAAKDRVFPVLLDPTLAAESLPAYLRAVHVLPIKGNAAAEIAKAVRQSRTLNGFCRSCLAFTGAAAAALAVGVALWRLPLPLHAADVAMVPPQSAFFRPLGPPPADLRAGDASTAWIESPVTLVVKMAYEHRNGRSAAANLIEETAELTLGGVTTGFASQYIVEFLDEGGCAGDWLCRKGNVGPHELAPGSISSFRETMFLSSATSPLTWRQFIDTVMADGGPAKARLQLRARISPAGGGERFETSYDCAIDLAPYRAQLRRAFTPAQDPRPPFLAPGCEPG